MTNFHNELSILPKGEPKVSDFPILAIDPGTEQSAIVQMWPDGRIEGARIERNADVRNWARVAFNCERRVAIEMVACYGMPVGREVFETCLFIGRLYEIAQQNGSPVTLVYRKDVKIHLCGSMKAKDGNIRQALIDKYGAPGTKKAPGRTYGISSHLWSALAIADYALCNPTSSP